MAYQPNLSDPRVINRITRAYGFARGIFSETQAHNWSSRYIDRYFGGNSHNISRWIRSVLLITTNERYNKDTGETKQYQLNPIGCQYVRDILQGRTQIDWITYQNEYEITYEQDAVANTLLYPSVTHLFDQEVIARWAHKEFGAELESKQFNYEDKANRLWHPLQSIKRAYKKPLLVEAGLKYHYDIQCSAPTLIHQHAQKQQDPMDLYLFALRNYLKNRAAIRQELAKQMETDERIIKVIINALFCGARIGHNPDFAISQLLDNDSARIEFLKTNEFIQELISDIRICWDYIKPSMARRSITNKNNREQMLPISSREKWMRYFELERQVVNAVRTYLDNNNIKYLLEHDGWACERELDRNELENYIWEQTGYQVILDVEIIKSQLERKMINEELISC